MEPEASKIGYLDPLGTTCIPGPPKCPKHGPYTACSLGRYFGPFWRSRYIHFSYSCNAAAFLRRRYVLWHRSMGSLRKGSKIIETVANQAHCSPSTALRYMSLNGYSPGLYKWSLAKNRGPNTDPKHSRGLMIRIATKRAPTL